MAVLVRFQDVSGPSWGSMEGALVRRVEGSVYGDWRSGSVVGSADEIRFLPPCEPTTVVALAYNYKDLVGFREAYDEPLVFLKSSSCVVGDTESILRPTWAPRVWVEVELALVLRSAAFCVSREQAERSILGYTLANDVTAVNVHGRDHHLARSKSLETFCPVGRFLHTDINTSALELTTRINGRVTQCGTTANRVLDDIESVMLISRFIQLQPGDVILTGTPAGAMDSLIAAGDDVQLHIEGVGQLNNPIGSRG